MSTEIMFTMIGVAVATLAAVLGIWMERDRNKPPRYAYALSVLILMASVVSMFQSYSDAKQGEKLEAEMARMLQMLDKIANTTEVEIPELNEFVKSEIAAQSRANPEVVQKMAQRMADEGEDPAEVLGSYLPASEVEGMQRKGALKIAPPKKAPAATTAAAAAPGASGEPAAGDGKPSRRKRLAFGIKADPSAAAAAKAAADKKDADKKDDDKKDAKADDKADDKDKKDADAGAPSKEAAADAGAPRVKIGLGAAGTAKPETKPAAEKPAPKVGVGIKKP